MNQKFLKFNLYPGLGLLLLSSVLLALRWPFMERWFYPFAWWSFILVMDSVNFRRSGRSLLSSSLKEFFLLSFFSVSFWCVFELFNLRLRNWSYHGLPTPLCERWLGYFVSYASVLPALMELEIFFSRILKGKNLSLFPFKANSYILKSFLAAGFACFLLPLLWPDFFFPLVWICFIFLLEPVNYKLGNPSLIREVEEGRWTRFWSLVLSGLTAGILWEFWNYWAGSQWEYGLPYLDFGRIFQMPALGFTGFLPFALEAFAACSLFLWAWRKWSPRVTVKILFFPVMLFLDGLAFTLIDLLTFKP